jgi:hypothetical protein
MQTQHKKVQNHEYELFVSSCVLGECHTASKYILNKKIPEYVVEHMQAAEPTYKRRRHTKNLLCPTLRFLLEGLMSPSNKQFEI